MSRIWRWEQGRLSYFLFPNLKLIAKSLLSIEGIGINTPNLDPMRFVLEKQTGLPFAPNTYKVWRNYKRVFECSMLATSIDNHLFVSDIAKELMASDFDADKYFSFFIPRFRFPYPSFSEYNPLDEPIYPFCAILKYLIASFESNQNIGLTIEDTFSKIIGNTCTGTEDLIFYKNLPKTNRVPFGDESRQVREMLIFMSQMSILKWHGGRLLLDVSHTDLLEYQNFELLSTPLFIKPDVSREKDFIALTSLQKNILKAFSIQSREISSEDIFTEGKRLRVTHIKIERSPLLRRLYFEKYPTTICDMCEVNTKKKYSWTDNLLEIHHILPLSSTLMVTSKGTSLDDVVPLCPNCHRSVHAYYKIWLNMNRLEDFKNRQEAIYVYQEAKNKVIK